jgi:NADPH:quinone reductase-like Zn-dependent oxidoreductase
VICDLVFGPPLAAALQSAAPGARVVQVGSAAGATAELSSAAIRGKQLEILGHSNLAASREVFADGYLAMVERAVSGDLVLEVTRVPLEDFPAAWAGTEAGSVKFAVVP